MQETYSDKKLYKRLIVRSILAILVILFLIFVLPNCFRLLFPFILAFIVAAILSPLINKINSKIKKLKIKSSVSKKIITIILYLLILLAISGFVYFVSYTIIKQIISLLSSIQNNWGSIVAGLKSFEGKITGLIDKTPQQVSEFIQNVSNNFIVFLENSVKNLLSSTVLTTTAMISKTGVFFLNFLTFFLALYFIAIDYDLMKDSLKSVIGRRLLESFNVMKNSALTALGGYIRAQLILGLIAFIFMFTAFLINGQPYALIIALLLGIVDLLPLLGTIAVLLPWGIIALITGDVSKGIFLIILGIGFFLIRKVIEPKITGTQIGLHPLLSLIGMYVGAQVSGLWGALLGPVIMVLFMGLIKSGLLTNTISDLKLFHSKITSLLHDR